MPDRQAQPRGAGRRHVYIEALRILACLAVIWNHTPRSGYFLFTTREPGSFLFYLELCLSIGCKFASPLFFAISGALLLGREISLRELWTKRIPRLVCTLAVFSLISYGIRLAAGKDVLDIKGFLFRAYDDNHNYAYWFLYAYVAFLIALPLLDALVRSLSDRRLAYLLGVAFLFKSLLPAIEQMRWGGAHQLNPFVTDTWLTSDILVYPVIGYALHRRMSLAGARRLLPWLCAASAVGLMISCQLTLREYYHTWNLFIQTYHTLFAGVYCATVFAGFRCLCAHAAPDGRPARITRALGSCTLGVYLLHVPIMDHTVFFQKTFWIPFDQLHVPQLLSGFLYCVTLMLFCAAITAVLKRIPGLRRLL